MFEPNSIRTLLKLKEMNIPTEENLARDSKSKEESGDSRSVLLQTKGLLQEVDSYILNLQKWKENRKRILEEGNIKTPEHIKSKQPNAQNLESEISEITSSIEEYNKMHAALEERVAKQNKLMAQVDIGIETIKEDDPRMLLYKSEMKVAELDLDKIKEDIEMHRVIDENKYIGIEEQKELVIMDKLTDVESRMKEDEEELENICDRMGIANLVQGEKNVDNIYKDKGVDKDNEGGGISNLVDDIDSELKELELLLNQK